jgi:hypothetical protein
MAVLTIKFRWRPREASGNSLGLFLRIRGSEHLRWASTALLHNCSTLECAAFATQRTV